MTDSKTNSSDLAASLPDEKELQPDSAILNLPEVNDIPGQEYVHPPHLREFADTTISSSDEEGRDLFDDEEEQDDSNVGPEEKKLLQRTEDSMSLEDDEDVFNAELDDTDTDGDPLNETIDTSGDDLDVPDGGEDEDKYDAEYDAAGDEDEENKSYSLGGDDHDEA